MDGLKELKPEVRGAITSNIRTLLACTGPVTIRGRALTTNVDAIDRLIADIGGLSFRKLISKETEFGEHDLLSLSSNCIVSVNLAGQLLTDISSLSGTTTDELSLDHSSSGAMDPHLQLGKGIASLAMEAPAAISRDHAGVARPAPMAGEQQLWNLVPERRSRKTVSTSQYLSQTVPLSSWQAEREVHSMTDLEHSTPSPDKHSPQRQLAGITAGSQRTEKASSTKEGSAAADPSFHTAGSQDLPEQPPQSNV